MSFEDYISEDAAAKLSGVSISTLMRFAETGYLSVETNSNGERLFSKNQLKEVFALEDVTAPAEPNAQFLAVEEPAAATAVSESSASSPKAESTPLPSNGDSTPPVQGNVAWPAFFQAFPTPAASTTGARASDEVTRELDQLRRDTTRFKNLADMQERLLDMREEELKEVKRERDWLRTRIEKLEEKQERDQILLLAETQTIRKLIAAQENRRSPIRMMIDWLNGTPATVPARSTTVVTMRPSQNQAPQQAAAQKRVQPKAANE